MRTIAFNTSKLHGTLLVECNGSAVILLCTSATTSTGIGVSPDHGRSHVLPVSSIFFAKSRTFFTEHDPRHKLWF